MDKEIKKLFLESFHIKNDAKLIPFSGYNMPINYKNGIIKEHLATRSDCGIFDVSHMLQINIIANEQTTKKLENIIPLDLYNLKIGKSAYSFILNDNGGIIDDLIISKIINNKDQILYYIVLNASRRFVDLKVLSETLGTTNLINTRNNYSLIAVQGPRSRELLSNIFPEIMKLSFMEIKNLIYDNFEILISCSGYTGEDGFELSIPNNIVTQLVKKILSSNEAFLCGLGSRDTLRLEAGLCLYGNELNENINPKEASLLWTIPKLRKNKMNFKGAIEFINKNPNKNQKIRIGILSLNQSIPRNNNNIYNNQNRLIGKVTSGSYSPTLKKPIAMGLVEEKYAIIGNKVFIESRGKKEDSIVVKMPFVNHNYKKY